MSSSTLQIPTARVFLPLLQPARYKGGWGGRGSGKSHFFAGHLIEDSLANRGLLSVCIREVQQTLKHSSKRLLETKISEFRLGERDGFRVYEDRIKTPGDGVIIFQGMADHTAESIKSLEGFKRAWIEEAQSLSARSLELLRPTIRAENSEIWASWNPRRKTDPIDQLLRGPTLPTGAVVVEANWRDNPWFTKELEQERLDCMADENADYDHIWGGAYATAVSGAYYARSLALAKSEGRIGKVARDPLMTIRAIWDIGGTGAKADACSIWICQFVGREIRVLDYYEAQGQELGVHVAWLRKNGYESALCILPHDGATKDRVFCVSYESMLREAGFKVRVVPNQGPGAAMMRVEAGRRVFPSVWFNADTTQAGIDTLAGYHPKRDEARNIDLGPDHDEFSHGCFHGDTKVLTRYGTHPIRSLPQTGEILTPCGWKPYINPRLTLRNAPLVEVRFVGGYSVKCTPDHLFLTESGWKSAESLQPNTAIQSTLTNSRSILTGICTGFGQRARIWQKAGASYIETCGNLLSGLFPQGAISTTGTGMYLTTALKTSNVLKLESIYPRLGGRDGSLYLMAVGFRLLQGIGPQIGTHPQKGAFGTKDTPNALRVGLSGSVKRSCVSAVARLSWRLFAGTWKRNTVAQPVKSLRIELAESLTNGRERPEKRKLRRKISGLSRIVCFAGSRTLLLGILGGMHSIVAKIVRKPGNWLNREQRIGLRIKSVQPLRERADVYDITVPDGHWFSLENGAVVHNSDAFGLMCVSYEAPGEKKKVTVKKHRAGLGIGGGAWMG